MLSNFSRWCCFLKHEIRNKESELNYCFQPFLFLLPQAIKYAKAKAKKKVGKWGQCEPQCWISKFFILLCQVNLQLFIFLGLSIVTNFRQQVKFLTKITINWHESDLYYFVFPGMYLEQPLKWQPFMVSTPGWPTPHLVLTLYTSHQVGKPDKRAMKTI